MSETRGKSFGRAGGSLANSSSWLGNDAAAAAGGRGESATARILDALARSDGGPTVLHDLRIPIPGIKANIDHVVISGRRVTIIDSKLWKPARYWTLFGVTRRGLERFAPADKKTLPMAAEALKGHLGRTGLRFDLRTPLLVVWPSNQRGQLSLSLLRSPGANAVSGAAFTSDAARLVGFAPADQKIVTAFKQLIIRSPR